MRIEPYPRYREQHAANEYNAPAEDGSRPGLFYINAYQADRKPRALAESTAFHETIPGHHLQNAIALERKDIILSSTQGASFFHLLLQNAKEGYFADPLYGGNHGMAAWVYIGFPGARAGFLEWVGVEKPYPLGPVSISGERA